MAIPISQIVPVTLNFRGTGLLPLALNARVFCEAASVPTSQTAGTLAVFSSLKEVIAAGFAADSDVYKTCNCWLSGLPTAGTIEVYYMRNKPKSDPADADVAYPLGEELAFQKDKFGWAFFIFVDAETLVTPTNLAAYANFSNVEMGAGFISAAETQVTPIITGAGNVYTTGLGSNYAYVHVAVEEPTQTKPEDKYNENIAVRVALWYASVNFSGRNTVTSAFLKRLSGAVPMDFNSTERNYLQKENFGWYATIDGNGQLDKGRYFNPVSFAGGLIGDRIFTKVLVNYCVTTVYNALATTSTKIAYTPAGYAILLNAVTVILKQFVTNGFLGERLITNKKGEEEIVNGFVMDSVPNDILTVPDIDRKEGIAPPITFTIYPSGAILVAPIQITI